MKNAQKGLLKGDSPTRHAQLSFLRNGLRCPQVATDHKRSCFFTPKSQVCFQEGDLKQVQFLKYVDDLL